MLHTATTANEPLNISDRRDLQVRWAIFVVDDHPLFRRGLAQTLSESDEFEVCGEAATAAEAMAALRQIACDAAVLDISLHGDDGIELLKEILKEHPDLPVLMLSVHPEGNYAFPALRAGARGYLTKNCALKELGIALRKVLDGGVYVSPQFGRQLIFKLVRNEGANPLERLTEREMEVFRQVGEGASSKEIAAALQLSVKTVESHRLHIKDKLELEHASEMVRFAALWRQYGKGDSTGAPAPSPSAETGPALVVDGPPVGER